MFSNTGGAKAVKSFYKALKVIFGARLVLWHAEEYYRAELGFRDCEVVLSRRPSVMRKMINVATGHPHRFHPYLKKYLLLHKDTIEWVISNGSIHIADLMFSKDLTSLKFAVIHHNFERDYAYANRNLYNFYGMLVPLIGKKEQLSYKLAHSNIFLSEYDRNKFLTSYGISSAVSHVLGVYLEGELEIPECIANDNNDKPYSLCITGALDFDQSISGIRRFVYDYLNTVNEIDLGCKILIAGRNPNKSLINVCKEFENVVLITNPDNMIEVVRKSRIYLCPIDVGGGVKLRVLDGLSAGLPVIVHEVAARGYECLFEKPYFKIYNDLKSFKDSYLQLLDYLHGNPESSTQIISDLNNYFGYNVGLRRLKEIFQNHD